MPTPSIAGSITLHHAPPHAQKPRPGLPINHVRKTSGQPTRGGQTKVAEALLAGAKKTFRDQVIIHERDAVARAYENFLHKLIEKGSEGLPDAASWLAANRPTASDYLDAHRPVAPLRGGGRPPAVRAMPEHPVMQASPMPATTASGALTHEQKPATAPHRTGALIEANNLASRLNASLRALHADQKILLEKFRARRAKPHDEATKHRIAASMARLQPRYAQGTVQASQSDIDCEEGMAGTHAPRHRPSLSSRSNTTGARTAEPAGGAANLLPDLRFAAILREALDSLTENMGGAITLSELDSRFIDLRGEAAKAASGALIAEPAGQGDETTLVTLFDTVIDLLEMPPGEAQREAILACLATLNAAPLGAHPPRAVARSTPSRSFTHAPDKRNAMSIGNLSQLQNALGTTTGSSTSSRSGSRRLTGVRSAPMPPAFSQQSDTLRETAIPGNHDTRTSSRKPVVAPRKRNKLLPQQPGTGELPFRIATVAKVGPLASFNAQIGELDTRLKAALSRPAPAPHSTPASSSPVQAPPRESLARALSAPDLSESFVAHADAQEALRTRSAEFVQQFQELQLTAQTGRLSAKDACLTIETTILQFWHLHAWHAQKLQSLGAGTASLDNVFSRELLALLQTGHDVLHTLGHSARTTSSRWKSLWHGDTRQKKLDKTRAVLDRHAARLLTDERKNYDFGKTQPGYRTADYIKWLAARGKDRISALPVNDIAHADTLIRTLHEQLRPLAAAWHYARKESRASIDHAMLQLAKAAERRLDGLTPRRALARKNFDQHLAQLKRRAHRAAPGVLRAALREQASPTGKDATAGYRKTLADHIETRLNVEPNLTVRTFERLRRQVEELLVACDMLDGLPAAETTRVENGYYESVAEDIRKKVDALAAPR
ncbi:hypothetical protein [Paludibacterium paludis]|uniref:Uncharacterized protein n=1 Tax=Paludibacterium paludis TaxID=1225769 RepID=A0A918U8H3_9NEIS|nr:hypothetical protein [Paludibacterium paludis]GGY09254.1 hypothetical protein GCM10011289_10020 [Paludibacterium paludis]